MVFKEIIRNNDLWNVFSNEKFPVSNTGKQKEGCCRVCIVWGLDSVYLEDGKGEKKKKNLWGIKPVKLCSAIVRASSEIYLEITALVSEALQRHQHHPLLITANMATVAMLARDSKHKHWSQEGAGRGPSWSQGCWTVHRAARTDLIRPVVLLGPRAVSCQTFQ